MTNEEQGWWGENLRHMYAAIKGGKKHLSDFEKATDLIAVKKFGKHLNELDQAGVDSCRNEYWRLHSKGEKPKQV